MGRLLLMAVTVAMVVPMAMAMAVGVSSRLGFQLRTFGFANDPEADMDLLDPDPLQAFFDVLTKLTLKPFFVRSENDGQVYPAFFYHNITD